MFSSGPTGLSPSVSLFQRGYKLPELSPQSPSATFTPRKKRCNHECNQDSGALQRICLTSLASAGNGFLNRRSQVRILPGVAFSRQHEAVKRG